MNKTGNRNSVYRLLLGGVIVLTLGLGAGISEAGCGGGGGGGKPCPKSHIPSLPKAPHPKKTSPKQAPHPAPCPINLKN